MKAEDTSVLIFAKAPVSGSVKTRLIPAIGADKAAVLQKLFIAEKIKSCMRANIGSVQLWCTPDTSHPTFQGATVDYEITLHKQADGDLGYRMFDACIQALEVSDNVILIGTDCPGIDETYLKQAQQALINDHDVVLGPAQDGGYVLIGFRKGVRKFIGEIFADITWGTSTVLAQTRQKLVQQGLHWKELPVRVDIDRPGDLTHLDSVVYADVLTNTKTVAN
jgi:rSAM/selenodomain-associated transferase 1